MARLATAAAAGPAAGAAAAAAGGAGAGIAAAAATAATAAPAAVRRPGLPQMLFVFVLQCCIEKNIGGAFLRNFLRAFFAFLRAILLFSGFSHIFV